MSKGAEWERRQSLSWIVVLRKILFNPQQAREVNRRRHLQGKVF